jgi:hypothetical protein
MLLTFSTAMVEQVLFHVILVIIYLAVAPSLLERKCNAYDPQTIQTPGDGITEAAEQGRRNSSNVT